MPHQPGHPPLPAGAAEAAAAWFPFARRWADGQEARDPNPIDRYYDAAVDGLLAAALYATGRGTAVSRGLLLRCMRQAVVRAWRAESRRRRREESAARPVVDCDAAPDAIDAADWWEAHASRLSPAELAAIRRGYWDGEEAEMVSSTNRAEYRARWRGLARLRAACDDE